MEDLQGENNDDGGESNDGELMDVNSPSSDKDWQLWSWQKKRERKRGKLRTRY